MIRLTSPTRFRNATASGSSPDRFWKLAGHPRTALRSPFPDPSPSSQHRVRSTVLISPFLGGISRTRKVRLETSLRSSWGKTRGKICASRVRRWRLSWASRPIVITICKIETFWEVFSNVFAKCLSQLQMLHLQKKS